jgi:hypothetical protein
MGNATPSAFHEFYYFNPGSKQPGFEPGLEIEVFPKGRFFKNFKASDR